jgi:hypothetical protein
MKAIQIMMALIFAAGIFFYQNGFAHGDDGTYQIKDGIGYYKNKKGNFEMQIHLDTNSNAYIITMSGKAKGYLGIGFGRTVKMKDAELIMGYVSNNTAYLGHYYGVDRTKAKPIQELDKSVTKEVLRVISAENTNGVSTITFSRPALLEGTYYKKFVSGEKIEFIYSLGKVNDFNTHHAERGGADIVIP